ncbi:hypothetical protein WAE58_04380 [Pedobacter panaciterrae]|uniref:Nucleoid associated protein NdpA n=1 Tax=Pedobacter panaciterrae TaxID=363849 RepID=A0ABU8NIH9_9SPHI
MEERQLELIKTSIFKIDLAGNQISETRLVVDDADFYNYIRGSINEVSLSTGGRKFKVRSASTQVISILLKNISDTKLPFDGTIADRLLREEIDVQTKIARMGKEISEGLLIISNIEDKGVKKAVVCKVEDNQYLNKVNLKLDSGYPLKRKIFRSAQFIFDGADEIIDVIVHDLNSKGATYWWDDFLELDQLWDDNYNTKTAFHIIDTKILSKIKKESVSDHTYLRNATIRYFRTTQEFTIEKFIEAVFTGYEPVLPDKLDIAAITESIKTLPEKFSFDERFDLKPSEITAKIKYAIHLTEEIDLVIKDEINIEKTIIPELVHNRKYIRIRSDEGYDAFNKKTK